MATDGWIKALYITEVEGYKCGDCEEYFEEPDETALYECGECGSQFNKDAGAGDGNQCPLCLRIAAQVSPVSCPECSLGPVSLAIYFVCGMCSHETKLHYDDLEDHVKSYHAEEMLDLLKHSL